jgi:signal transduction histidine kinase/ligand-binding sensor domain-containing protein
MRLFLPSKKLPHLLEQKILSIIRSLISLCLLVFFISTAFAAQQYRIENWSTEQGLPYKTVRSVVQTRDGYVWAATADGLARFDGIRFTVFNTANTPSLVTNSFGKLVEANDGSLWIEVERRGLIRYKDGVFTNYTTARGLPGEWIWSLQYFPSENLLRVGTPEGYARFDGEKFVREDLPKLSIEPKNITFTDNTGAIWSQFGNELRSADGKSAETFSIPSFFSRSPFNLLYRDRAGNLWLAIGDVLQGYVVRFHGDKTDIFSNKDGLPDGTINSIFEDSKGNLWFGSKQDGGLSIYQSGKFERLAKDGGILREGFNSFFEDREGGIWAGTLSGGLMRFSSQIIKSFSAKDGLSGKGVYPLYEDRTGTIWIGDWGNAKGLHKFENGELGTVGGGALYTSLFQDRDGALWVGSYNQIGKIENGKFSGEFSLPEKPTSAITQDYKGVLWFGSGDGLRRMKISQTARAKPQILTPNPDESFDHFTVKNGLPGDDVKVLHFDRNGTLWIGTTGGLAKFENEQITAFTEKDGLSGNHIRSIYEDANGVLWFGTFDNGLTRLKDGKFTAIRVKDGLFDQGAFQILEDDFGRFWISSNRGIYRINKQELNDFADGRITSVTSVAYGAKDGMTDAECNGGTSPAGFKSKRDGTLWFPTQNGIVVINPKALAVNTSPPTVNIEYCLIDGKETPCDRIKILPENDSLEIKYTGLSFNKPDQIKFKYKLEGLDENWVDAGTRRRAFFTHLPPGEYSFRVSAANVDGVWNETGANLKITVKPPFYRTLWFLALCAVLASAIILAVFNLRIKNLKKIHAAQEEFSRKLLESQENERQRIAAELHDSLGQDLLIIKNWAVIGMKNGADSKIQFAEISETASAAIDEVREIAYNLRPYHLDELGLTKAIEAMCGRVSHSSGIDFNCSIDNLDDFFPTDAEINFYRIAQECVNNIVKHSGASEAEIRIKRSADGSLLLSIWDNGKGFDADLAALKRASQSGFGLAGINERARILGGKLVINSGPGEGTTVKLTFV